MRKFGSRSALLLVPWATAALVAVSGCSVSGAGPGSAGITPAAGSMPGLGSFSLTHPFGPPERRPVPLSLDHSLGPIAWSAAGPFRDGEVLLGFRSGTSIQLERALERRAGGAGAQKLGMGMLLTVPRGDVPQAVKRLRADALVRYAEPNYVMRANGLANDPQFGLQWGLQNTGQAVNGSSGTANADEHAAPAWNVTTGSSSVVVAVADTGVEYTHPDLAANIWSNPGGLGGCAGGTHGFDVLAGENACDPMDTDTAYGGHGTHVAGIIGAVGNNGVGVTGVNWTTTILPVKWLDSNSSGVTSDLINALQKVIALKRAGVNIRVVNDSPTFPGTAYSQALSDELDQLGANDILFVTPAGNTSQNNDTTPRYPCSYDRPNEICVAATDQNDQLPSWTNWGVKSVDLAAPGNNIYSTLRNASYGYINGSSMSAAEVSGAAALTLAAGYQSVTALKADLLNNVDPVPSLSGMVRTGGRLDVCRAMPGCTLPQSTATTFGKTTVGANTDTAGANRKRVNRYAVSGNVTVTKLSVYLQPTSTSGTQALEGVIYADAAGSPTSLLAVSNQLTFASTQSAGWYDLTFPTPVNLAAGNYWIGFMSGSTGGVASFRYDYVSGSRDLSSNTYASGPSNPFGSASNDSEQMSVYATYTNPIPLPASSPPADFTPPAISGAPQVAQTLTASNGTWTGSPTGYNYQWLRCSASGSNCAPIAGATAKSYTVAGADAGSALAVSVSASNPAGSASASSASTAAVSGTVPSSTAPPGITGTAQAGQTLSASNGSWAGSPTSYAYQWQRCGTSGTNCNPVAGATSQTYTVAGGDVGSQLEVAVTASNALGSAAATSTPTATVLPPAPTNTAPPATTGSAEVNQTLSASNGSWTGSPISYTYQWLRCDPGGGNCNAIWGATSQTYTVVDGDVASVLEVTVTAFNSGGSTAATSAPTASVPAVAPTNTAPPAISGTAQLGQSLSARNGSWSGTSPSYSYQWQRCDPSGNNCTAIGGAISPTYIVADADVGGTLAVTVTASNAAGTALATSAPTATITAVAPSNTAAPAISGNAQVGQSLTSSNGSWTGSPTSYSYQWLRCDTSGNNCAPISGASSQTYAVTDADQGSTVEVTVTAANAAGATGATSTPTAPVIPPAPANTTPPIISGAAQVGQMLSTSNGTWAGSPTGYSYQWQRCDTNGNNCTAITGATSQTYTVAGGDIGATLEVAVTASNSAGSSAATSATTVTVPQVPPSDISPPTISGTAQSGQTLTGSTGIWTGTSPAYSYQWQRCDASGNNCSAISSAGSQTYTLTTADVGNTIEAVVTASNAAGSSTAASAPTSPVQAAPPVTLGKTTVGSLSDVAGSNRKRVNRYVINANATVSKLTIYLQPTSTSGTQALEGVIYADSAGSPNALLAVSNQLTFASTQSPGWYDLTFPTPAHITPGTYWIGFMSGNTYGVAGFRWDSVSGSRAINSDTFTAGATNPFGAPTVDSEQMSLYATYTPG